MKNPIIIVHARGAPGLRFLGIGANFKPNKGIEQLKNLLNDNTSWASNRSQKDIKNMLGHSSLVVSMWNENQMIGFGRATSDAIFRAVLWDVVIAKKYQNKGLGKQIVETMLNNPKISQVEKVYIMTTNFKSFYSNVGFEMVKKQDLMIFKHK